jgi:hypothetical protein
MLQVRHAKVGVVHAGTREGQLARCTVNGVDVTDVCVAADDQTGWAQVYVKDGEGRFVIDETAYGGPALKMTVLQGDVVITVPRGLD